MKDKMQRTPTPWTIDTNDNEYIINTNDGLWFTLGGHYGKSNKYIREKTEIIIRAVNSHESLLKALKELVYQTGGRYFVGLRGDTDVTDIVSEAIAQAEGGK